MAGPSPAWLERVRRKSLHKLFMQPEDTIKFFKNGMTLGWSGFTPAGYPKVVPIALADHVEKNNLQGKLRFNLMVWITGQRRRTALRQTSVN